MRHNLSGQLGGDENQAISAAQAAAAAAAAARQRGYSCAGSVRFYLINKSRGQKHIYFYWHTACTSAACLGVTGGALLPLMGRVWKTFLSFAPRGWFVSLEFTS